MPKRTSSDLSNEPDPKKVPGVPISVIDRLFPAIEPPSRLDPKQVDEKVDKLLAEAWDPTAACRFYGTKSSGKQMLNYRHSFLPTLTTYELLCVMPEVVRRFPVGWEVSLKHMPPSQVVTFCAKGPADSIAASE